MRPRSSPNQNPVDGQETGAAGAAPGRNAKCTVFRLQADEKTSSGYQNILIRYIRGIKAHSYLTKRTANRKNFHRNYQLPCCPGIGAFRTEA